MSLLLVTPCAYGPTGYTQVTKVDTEKPKRKKRPAGTPQGGNTTPNGQTAKTDVPTNVPDAAAPEAPQRVRPSLAKITRDTGDIFPPDVSPSIDFVLTRRGNGHGVWIITIPAPDGVGNNAFIYVYKAKKKKFQRLLALKSVQQLSPKVDAYHKNYPDFVYTASRPAPEPVEAAPPPPPQLYEAVLKFDGKKYREDSCRVGVPAEPENLTPVRCDGRGMSEDEKPSP